MKVINSSLYKISLLLFSIFHFSSCDNSNNENLQNDLFLRGTEPIMVGCTMEFVYSLGSTDGNPLKAVEIIAPFSGDKGTKIYKTGLYTNPNNGNDEEVLIITDTETDGSISKAYFIDTIAASVRYSYVVPKEAQGKDLKFHFRGITDTSSSEITSMTYHVNNIEIFKGFIMNTEKNCFSIENMKTYTIEEVNSNGIQDKIDFIYTYKPTMGSGFTFNHALVSPSNEKGYLYPIEIPYNCNNKTLIEKRLWPDGQLKTSGIPSVYVDEIDLRNAQFDGITTHAYDLLKDQGIIIKSHDEKYIIYLYINDIDNELKQISFSIKRLTIK